MLTLKPMTKSLPHHALLVLLFILIGNLSAFSIQLGPPSKVEAAFKEHFPDVNNVIWEQDDRCFIANYKEKNTIARVFFDSLGNILESEKEISIKDLPEKVILYIRTQDETAKIIKAYKIEKKDQRIELYDVVAKIQFKRTKITISRDGYLTSR
jgi:hypothetical protein